VFVLSADDKVAIATEIAGRPDRSLFFVRTKHGAARLAKQMTRAGVPAAAIHGNLNQNQRQRALGAFTAGHPRVLVATDVAARGLHIDDVGLVVHFDPPNDHKDYLHRSGRTARAGAAGTVLALVDPGQVRDVARLHDAAGVTPTSHQVQSGDHAVREIATSGTPVPPPPDPEPARAERPARPTGSRNSRGGPRGAGAGGSGARGSGARDGREGSAWDGRTSRGGAARGRGTRGVGPRSSVVQGSAALGTAARGSAALGSAALGSAARGSAAQGSAARGGTGSRGTHVNSARAR
jgi:superfamily II DNA/RNA helicase